MSIPAGRTSYFGRFENPEQYRMINQAGTRVRVLTGTVGEGYASCWDMTASPFDGTMYMAPTDERKGVGAHTRLVSYDHATDTFKICAEVEKLILPHPLQMPHSKLHTSINFMTDGTVIATTHTTAGPAHHPEWMPLAHIDHPYDGFAGSNIIHYDPKTGVAENWGVPVPRESIYGSCYDPKHNRLYMIGFMRGHVYCFDIETRTVKDLGKQAEIFNYRLHYGPDGNIYSCTKSGFLYRVNTETNELEDMNWRVPAYMDNDQNNTWYRYMSQARNLSDHEFVFVNSTSEDLFLFDTDTLTVKNLGKRSPFDYTSDFHISPLGLDEIAMDKYGVLWYALNMGPQRPIRDDFYHYPCPQFLIRWDVKNSDRPECLGIISTEEYNTPTAYCFCIDTVNDILYMEGAGYSPKDKNSDKHSGLGVFMLDLKEFRQHMYEPGPVFEAKVTPYTDEEIEKAKNYVKTYAGEEVSGANPTTMFSIEKVTPIRLWRAVPHTEIPESKVIGLAWEDENLYGTCGDNGQAKYAFKIVPQTHKVYDSECCAKKDHDYMVIRSIFNGVREMKTWTDENGKFCVEVPQSYAFRIEWIKPIEEVCECRRKWMEANLLPGPANIDPKIKLPEVIGRRYASGASAAVNWNGDRIAVGTNDAMFALVRGFKVHSYGACATMGPVRCMCTNADKTKLYGVAGHELGMSTVFSFDDDEGLRQLGFVNYNSPGYMDGPTAANVLSSITLSADEKYLAVGGADRIGSVHIFKL
ncbi:MAG: PQQ-like beta-propeller repeat protein [Clostridia bacterium]|nr:PQQ-like beta-propeller repeat protein [Clostridia bacterium]